MVWKMERMRKLLRSAGGDTTGFLAWPAGLLMHARLRNFLKEREQTWAAASARIRFALAGRLNGSHEPRDCRLSYLFLRGGS
jgi:hypothetical protein